MTLDMFNDEGIVKSGAEVRLFSSEEFGSVRVIQEGDNFLFCAKDVAAALGYSNTKDAIIRHCKGVVKRDLGVVTGKKTDGSNAIQVVSAAFIPEGDLYRLVTHSKLPSAKKFERWVFDDVLPSIRKTGSYSGKADAVREALDSFNVPKDYLSALKLAVSLEERRQELAAKVSELEPKARYHDNVLNSGEVYSVTQIAKDYGMSAKGFNRLLAEMGIQYQFKRGGQWFLYAEYQDKGYTKSVTVPLGNEKSAAQTKWTEKGREFLYYEPAKMGIYPTADASLSPSDARVASRVRLEAGGGYSIGLLKGEQE